MTPLPKPSEMALIAAATYVGPWKWQTDDVKVTDTRLGDYRVIAFRGTTSDGLDILRDIRFMPWWSHRIGIAPAGFFKGTNDVIDAILLDCSDDIRAGTLVVVGHSLGGSLALITAAWIVALGWMPAAVFTFEPAPCGGFKARRLWKKIPSVFVSWDGIDIVPRVPFLYRLPDKVDLIGTVTDHPTRWQIIKSFFTPSATIRRALLDHRIMQVHADLVAAGL